MAPPKTSKESGALIRTGPKQVQKHHKVGQRKLDADGRLPTTSRALVLRNGKHGSQGTGEIVLSTKISGREKLDLLAEDLTTRSQTAVMRPFNLAKCLKIADAQCHAFLDDICLLKDKDLFYSAIVSELRARTAAGQEVDRTPTNVASVIATRVHNSYMLASSWNLIYRHLKDLEISGLQDNVAAKQLQENESLRSQYMALYWIIQEITNLGQEKVANLAMTTPHYASYFKKRGKTDEMYFDWQKLREAGRSFLDSIILEICFPRAPYAQAILFNILNDAIAENPREAKRFPQALFDAVGDLAVIVELQEMLEGPLLGVGQQWKSEQPVFPEDFNVWLAAQTVSEEATNGYPTFKNLIFPLEKTQQADSLAMMWKMIDLNYQKVGGVSAETLWQLHDAFKDRPSWSSPYSKISEHTNNFDEVDADDGPPPLTGGGRKQLALTSGDDDDEDSDGSMPDLQSVSNSSEEGSDYDSDSDDDDGSDNGASDADGEYDDDFEDEMRDFHREAMDMLHELDLLEQTDINPLDNDDRKGNPFLKLLGSLRGRMFSSNSKLKSGRKPGSTSAATGGTKPPPKTGGASKTTSGGKVSLEEVEDEEEGGHGPSKKKKKKKKTKKKTAPAQPTIPEDQPATPPPSAPTPVVPTSPSKPKVAGAGTSLYTQGGAAVTSTTSVAQSMRSYIESEGLGEAKEKIKTHTKHGNILGAIGGLFSRKPKAEKTKEEQQAEKDNTLSWFRHVSKKTRPTLDQLFHLDGDSKVKPMKWDSFCKLMQELGFTQADNTAGSSVRFDPPNPSDKPFMVHRPHPDPVWSPKQVLDIGRRMQRHYGWTKDHILLLAKDKK